MDYVQIGKRIREARNAKGCPQAELAFRAVLALSCHITVHPALGSSFNLRTMLIERFGQYHIGESDGVYQSQILLSHTPPFPETDIRLCQFDVGNSVFYIMTEFHLLFQMCNF